MTKNVTGSGSTTIFTGSAPKVLLQVNAALTGTIAVLDGATTVATITNPTVGGRYEYWDFGTSVIVNPNGSCDITVSVATAPGK